MWLEAEISGANEHWYLIHCQPRKETYAANSLRYLLNLLVFVPESQVRSRGEIKCIPFFPGYIFIRADLQKVSRSHINTCPGVLRLVEFGGDPQTVPQYVIDTIAQQLSKSNGLHALSTHRFRPGDVVQIKQGPLQDLEMVFVGSTLPGGRVHVLLELLGRLKEVPVDGDMLEKAPAASLLSQELSRQRERYLQRSKRAM